MNNFEIIKLMDKEEMADFLAQCQKEVIDFFEKNTDIKTDFNLDNQTQANLKWLNEIIKN